MILVLGSFGQQNSVSWIGFPRKHVPCEMEWVSRSFYGQKNKCERKRKEAWLDRGKSLSCDAGLWGEDQELEWSFNSQVGPRARHLFFLKDKSRVMTLGKAAFCNPWKGWWLKRANSNPRSWGNKSSMKGYLCIAAYEYVTILKFFWRWKICHEFIEILPIQI